MTRTLQLTRPSVAARLRDLAVNASRYTDAITVRCRYARGIRGCNPVLPPVFHVDRVSFQSSQCRYSGLRPSIQLDPSAKVELRRTATGVAYVRQATRYT